jgi:DNA mismatch repair protein MutL
MMNNIQILPASVAELIAAGEVIENPLSVVKELIENAIDAGAKCIEIEISDGGMSLIRVSDDGCGMRKEDIVLCTSRHATSKLSCFEDLFRVKTLGFRGEALASIVSVSDVEIISSVAGEETGHRFFSSWSGQSELSEHGRVKGTSVVVRNLFVNMPARLKFLKSARSEGNKITQFLQNIALGYSDLTISLIRDAKKIFKIQVGESVKNRAQVIWELYRENDLIEVNAINDQKIGMTGFVGNAETLWHNRTRQLFFVNQRLVNSRVIDNALRLAFKDYMMQNKYPVAVLLIDIQTEEVDVNIHPRKSEVKFQDEEKIFDFVRRTVSEALKKNMHVKNLFTSDDFDLVPKKDAGAPYPSGLFFPDDKYLIARDTMNSASAIHEVASNSQVLDKGVAGIGELPARSNLLEKDFVLDNFILKELIREGQMTPVGLNFFSFTLCEHHSFLLLLDQHAIHEKYIYERMIVEYKKNGFLTGQKLLIPYFFECDYETVDKLEAVIDSIGLLGYDVEIFGNHEIVLRKVPAFLYERDFTGPIIELADLLSKENAFESIFKMMACKSAIKATKPLSVLEIEELLRLILEMEDPLKCPHGRPTCILLTKEDFEKGLKRRL